LAAWRIRCRIDSLSFRRPAVVYFDHTVPLLEEITAVAKLGAKDYFIFYESVRPKQEREKRGKGCLALYVHNIVAVHAVRVRAIVFGRPPELVTRNGLFRMHKRTVLTPIKKFLLLELDQLQRHGDPVFDLIVTARTPLRLSPTHR
jgi:hypothetical protein